MSRRAIVRHPGWLEALAVIALTAALALVGPDLTPRRSIRPAAVSAPGPPGAAAGSLVDPAPPAHRLTPMRTATAPGHVEE